MVEVPSTNKEDVRVEPQITLVSLATVALLAEGNSKIEPVNSTVKPEEKKKKDKPVAEDANDMKILGVDSGEGGDLVYEGVSLRVRKFFNKSYHRDRFDVFVLKVPADHPDRDPLLKLEEKDLYLSTFIARKYEKYPRENLRGDRISVADSMEALWRLVRRALGVTAPMGSAELKKVA